MSLSLSLFVRSHACLVCLLVFLSPCASRCLSVYVSYCLSLRLARSQFQERAHPGGYRIVHTYTLTTVRTYTYLALCGRLGKVPSWSRDCQAHQTRGAGEGLLLAHKPGRLEGLEHVTDGCSAPSRSSLCHVHKPHGHQLDHHNIEAVIRGQERLGGLLQWPLALLGSRLKVLLHVTVRTVFGIKGGGPGREEERYTPAQESRQTTQQVRWHLVDLVLREACIIVGQSSLMQSAAQEPANLVSTDERKVDRVVCIPGCSGPA